MKNTNILFLTIIQLISIVFLTQFYGIEGMIIILIVLIGLGILFNFVRPLKGFAVLISVIIGFGFYLSGRAWIYNYNNLQQLEIIGLHILFTLLTGSLWIQIHLIRNLIVEVQYLKSRIVELEKYEEHHQVLTYNEFLSQLKVVYTGLARRRENGFIVIVEINRQGKEYGLKTLFQIVSESAIESIRNNYDLVGKLSDSKLVLLLQNTDEKGLEIVNERFFDNLNKSHFPMPYIKVKCIKLLDEWCGLEMMLKEEAKELMVG